MHLIYLASSAHFSGRFFFFNPPCSSLIFPQTVLSHKSTASYPAEEVGLEPCTLQPVLVCRRDDKGRDRRRAIREASSPVSCCSRAGKAPRLWRGTSNVREQQSTRDLLQDIQGFEPFPLWSLPPLFTSVESFQSMDIIWCNCSIMHRNNTKCLLSLCELNLKPWAATTKEN